MITIIHGDNLVESRKALVQKTKQAAAAGLEIVKLDGQKIGIGELRNTLESTSLFGSNKLVVLENLLSGVKSTKKESIKEYLSKGKFDNDLILWELKEIKLINLNGAKCELYKITPAIFKFLDSLKPNNTSEMLHLLADVEKQEEPEMIFYMICRHVRLLLIASDPVGLTKSSLASWQMGKYGKQAKYFNPETLKEIYSELEVIDYNQKTSGDSYSLSSRLDLFIASL